jgi:hypothetical protein
VTSPSPLDARPVVVASAGPNGAGKTTFFGAHLQPAGLRFVNADEIGRELSVGVYEAAEAASHIRQALLDQRESFVFDNGDLARPFRKVAVYERGKVLEKHPPWPRWLPRGR